MAGGVALTGLATVADLATLLDVLGAGACLLGGVVAASAPFAWRAAERALRLGRPLPAPRLVTVLAIGISLIAVVLAGYALAQL